MEYTTIIQDDKKIIVTKKTVDWLVKNTQVDYFDPINLSGYQRKIDKTHCDKIVDYILRDFYMPSSIICSIRKDEYNEKEKLFIVDGQHRVEAFRILMNSDKKRYDEIANYELPVVVLINPDVKVEIETFITINKTSKKVDTSLAMMLRNRLNEERSSDDLVMPRREYIATDIAWNLNFEEEDSPWFNNILFEGNPKQNVETISLNAFVKSTKVLVGCFERHGLLNCQWNSEYEINEIENRCIELIKKIWENAKNKWPALINDKNTDKSIIFGPIGYNAINKVIIYHFDKDGKNTLLTFDNAIKLIEQSFEKIDNDIDLWLPKGRFSKYSSESGYSVVAMELIGK